MPNTRTQPRALFLDVLIATGTALLLGFALGVASEALAGEPTAPEPTAEQVVHDAKVATHQALKEARNRKLVAEKTKDVAVAECLSPNVMMLQGAWRTVSDASDDYRLADLRGDLRGAARARDRVQAGSDAGRRVLEEARRCDGRSARLARGDGSVHVIVTVNGVEDTSLGRRRGASRPRGAAGSR